MINRVLIRIKVIQILYSYLLVEKKFSFESNPMAPTKEKRFAYALYLDMLVLMFRIAENIQARGGYSPLADTRFIKRIKSDEQIKSLIQRYRIQDFPFAEVVGPISEKIKESGLYKNFRKDIENPDCKALESIWKEIFSIFIIPDPRVNSLIEERANYTLKGVDRMRGMMESTFVNFMESQDNGADAVAALRKSLDKARDLYLMLLLLPVELTHLENQIIDERRHRYLVTEQDLNPNMKFVENAFTERLEADEMFRTEVESRRLSWLPDERYMLESLLGSIRQSDIYKEYMENPQRSLRDDCEFWRAVYRRVIFTNETFLETLEDKSVFWNDDLDIMGTFVLKSLRRIEESESGMVREDVNDSDDPLGVVLRQFKDDEDRKFGPELVHYVTENKDVYRSYIDDALHERSWDRDRLAFMDVLILETALAEILNFPGIPLTVSLNEYIEIAKSYSTSKSGSFVHGILGAVVARLKEEGKLLK